MGRHTYYGDVNSRARRQNTKVWRGVANVVDTRRLDELLNERARASSVANDMRGNENREPAGDSRESAT